MVGDCVTSALDKDGDLPSTQTEAIQGLAAKVMVAVSSASGEKAHNPFESALLWRLIDIVHSSASCTKFSGRKQKMWKNFHAIRSTELVCVPFVSSVPSPSTIYV